MSREPDKRNAPELSHVPFGLSGGDAETWLKRGEALGRLLNRMLRGWPLRSGLGAAPRRIKDQGR